MSATLGVVAIAYGMAAAASSLLQARRMHRRRTSADISLGFLSSYIGGYAIWLAYGLSIGSLPLIAVDAVGLLCGGATLLVALRLRPRRRPRTTGLRAARVDGRGPGQVARAGRSAPRARARLGSTSRDGLAAGRCDATRSRPAGFPARNRR